MRFRIVFVAFVGLGPLGFAFLLHCMVRSSDHDLRLLRKTLAQAQSHLTQLTIQNARSSALQGNPKEVQSWVALSHLYAKPNELFFEIRLPEPAPPAPTKNVPFWTRLRGFLWSNAFFAGLAGMSVVLYCLWAWASGKPPKPPQQNIRSPQRTSIPVIGGEASE